MHILFVSARESSYARNDVLLRALRRFAIVHVIAPIVQPKSLVVASAIAAMRAAPQLAARQYDLVFVGFYGSLILPLLRPLTRAPILFDAFVSNYDTLAFDRAAFAPNSRRGQMALALDRATCALANAVMLDTQAHVDYFVETLGVNRRKLHALPVGCNEEVFRPTPQPSHASLQPTSVLYYCTYLPLHGVETVLHAAAYLGGQDVRFRLIGDGPLRPAMEELAHDLRLRNTRFLAPMPAAQIAEELRGAHIVLGGHFGSGGKAQRTVPGKIYQMLAAERPVIAADSLANHELLTHGVSAWLVPPQDPPALALAILALHENSTRRTHLAVGGREAYLRLASETRITERVREIVEPLMRA